MKKLFLIIATVLSFGAMAQSGSITIGEGLTTLGLYSYPAYDCGERENFETYTEWITIDTLGTIKDTVRNWVYSKEINCTELFQTLSYNPCKGSSNASTQERICKITGIIQKRIKTYGWHYVKTLTEYEKTVQSFNK